MSIRWKPWVKIKKSGVPGSCVLTTKSGYVFTQYDPFDSDRRISKGQVSDLDSNGTLGASTLYVSVCRIRTSRNWGMLERSGALTPWRRSGWVYSQYKLSSTSKLPSVKSEPWRKVEHQMLPDAVRSLWESGLEDIGHCWMKLNHQSPFPQRYMPSVILPSHPSTLRPLAAHLLPASYSSSLRASISLNARCSSSSCCSCSSCRWACSISSCNLSPPRVKTACLKKCQSIVFDSHRPSLMIALQKLLAVFFLVDPFCSQLLSELLPHLEDLVGSHRGGWGDCYEVGRMRMKVRMKAV